jgi:glycosyltransferase involved in cell wall biosynthesis
MKPKVVVLARTRNSEKYIGNFVVQYFRGGAANILIADGGSEDSTIAMLESYEQESKGVLQVRDYEIREEVNGVWVNPQWSHLNFLIDWAEQETDADWFVFDDIDCWPNYELRDGMLGFFEVAEAQGKTAVFAYRLHIFKGEHYFPDMNIPGQSLWAWHRKAAIRSATAESLEAPRLYNIPEKEDRLYLHHPYVLLHNTWPNDTEVARKMHHYRQVRGVKHMPHPLQSGGKLASLPPYALIDRPLPDYQIPETEVAE